MRRSLAYALIPVTPAFWSATFALSVMLPFAWSAFRRHGMPSRRDWIDSFLLGGLGMWICGAFVYYGGRSTSALNIGLMYALSPVLIAVFSALWLKERLNLRQALGVCLAFMGVVWIVTRGAPLAIAGIRWVEGDLWIAVAVLCWTAYSLLLRQRTSRLDPFARLSLILDRCAFTWFWRLPGLFLHAGAARRCANRCGSLSRPLVRWPDGLAAFGSGDWQLSLHRRGLDFAWCLSRHNARSQSLTLKAIRPCKACSSDCAIKRLWVYATKRDDLRL
ncbi:MAG: EamA family transporter [Betaproteobacteria bacterium]|nr:EamA family transporter [Betaproteobacteria bacterium]